MIFVIDFVLVSSFKTYCLKLIVYTNVLQANEYWNITSIISFCYLGYTDAKHDSDAGSYKLPPTSEPINTAYTILWQCASVVRPLLFVGWAHVSFFFFYVKAIFSMYQTNNVTHLIKLFVLCSFILKASI